MKQAPPKILYWRPLKLLFADSLFIIGVILLIRIDFSSALLCLALTLCTTVRAISLILIIQRGEYVALEGVCTCVAPMSGDFYQIVLRGSQEEYAVCHLRRPIKVGRRYRIYFEDDSLAIWTFFGIEEVPVRAD